MRRVDLKDSEEWRRQQIEGLLCGAVYGSPSEGEEVLWFGSGRYFTVVLQFPEVTEEEAQRLEWDVNVFVNYDYRHVFVRRYRGSTEISTQPMSLEYHRAKMPWEELFERFARNFDTDSGLVIGVDVRNVKGDAEERITQFLERNWAKFEEFCAGKGLQPNMCCVSFIRRNLEFRIIKNVTQRETLLVALRFVDALCGSDLESMTWEDLIQRLEEFYVE